MRKGIDIEGEKEKKTREHGNQTEKNVMNNNIAEFNISDRTHNNTLILNLKYAHADST